MPKAAAPDAPALDVRIAPVKSPVHLREVIAWRRSEVEIGFYQQRRWAELPATYVERALGRELGAAAASSVAGSGAGTVIFVELQHFEEVLAPVHEAHVALAIQVDRRGCDWSRVAAARQPIADDEASSMARAMGLALEEVVRVIGRDLRRALAERRCAAS
jgi:ABC-type uncharacterized transport system auxiliary subunit